MIPVDCRTNKSLENYNKYIKTQLGKHRKVNWVNFINFIKEESSRNLNRLISKNEINNTIKRECSLNNKTISYSNNIKDEIIEKNPNENKLELNGNYIKELIKCIKDLNISKQGETLYIKNVRVQNKALNCYINSILQILFHTESLLNEIKKKKSNIKSESVVYKLNENINDMNKQNDENEPINITNFLHFFCLKHKKFVINE